MLDIHAVAFDLDNTLWNVEPVMVRAEDRWFEWLRANCPRIVENLSLRELRQARQDLAALEPHQAHDFTYLRIASLARLARQFGYDEQIAERAFEIFAIARNELDLYPDVRPGLQRLGRQYKLATLSNGNADLRRIGIAQLFAVSLNARGIGAAKPARRCFEHLVEALQLDAPQVLYVGDDPLMDVEAARAAGLPTAWMNRTGQVWPAGVREADMSIPDCLQLASRLGV
jgi:putative hydrolase of the HAD superfamily